MSTVEDHAALRSGCSGIAPLSGRLEPWMIHLLESPEQLAQITEQHGSPVNLLDVSAMARNGDELMGVAQRFGVDLKIFFARKANKALAFVDEAQRLGMGIDLASEVELEQVLARGIDGSDLIMTAAVKPLSLIERCLRSETVIAIDNDDELEHVDGAARSLGVSAQVALRIAPDLGDSVAETRFGLTPDALASALRRVYAAGPRLTVAGVHFHIDGYSVADRVVAVRQALGVVGDLTARGHHPRFIDIGGGIPMRYLDDAEQWERFWAEHRRALDGDSDELTFRGHPLTTVYPYHQPIVRGQWLEQILTAAAGSGATIAERLSADGLQLRCEPGRSLLDGCGMTVARVEFRKQRRDCTWLIGLAMNRTQCRSTSDDFMVDPLLVAGGEHPGPAIEAYLVGAYCIERELITLRKLHFPNGVAVGDLVAFPNTAGYLMHILESTSHQIPLARNLVVDGTEVRLDDIENG